VRSATRVTVSTFGALAGLAGLAFSVAAMIDGQLSGPRTEPTVIAVHLAISAVSFALLAVFLRGLGRRGEAPWCRM